MSDTPYDLTLDILKQLQAGFAEIRAQFSEMRGQFGEVNARLDRLEELSRKHRRNAAGMLVLMQSTVGDFDERVREVEERLEAPEKNSS